MIKPALNVVSISPAQEHRRRDQEKAKMILLDLKLMLAQYPEA